MRAATGCNIVIGSREEKVYRYEPRENDAAARRALRKAEKLRPDDAQIRSLLEGT